MKGFENVSAANEKTMARRGGRNFEIFAAKTLLRTEVSKLAMFRKRFDEERLKLCFGWGSNLVIENKCRLVNVTSLYLSIYQHRIFIAKVRKLKVLANTK